MLMVSSPRLNPSPWQVPHLAVISEPSPLQVGHVLVVCIWPNMVLVTRRTAPLPPQVRQVLTDDLSFAPEPLQLWQTTCLFTFIFFSTPLAISSRVSLTLMRKLLPRATRRPPRVDCPPPKKLSKGLPPPPPKISPNWLKISSMFMFPAPPEGPPCPALAWPNWS